MKFKKKKILHFTYMPDISVGILQKIRNAAAVASREDKPVYFSILTNQEMDDEPHLFFIKNRYSIFKKIIFSNLLKNTMLFDHLDSGSYDYIYFRYITSPGLLAGFIPKRLRGKIISEHHTKERFELIFNRSFGIKTLLDLVLEEFFGKSFLKNCIGITGVSQEVIDFEKNRGIKLPNCVISNGTDVKNTSFSGFTPFDGEKLRMITISSAFYKWQGLDRILKSILCYEGEIEIHINIVGRVISPIEKDLIERCKKKEKVYIYEHGMLDRIDVEKIIDKVNLAISTLCLYRKGMRSTSSIKNCEFMARGLPFIVGHHDPNIDYTSDYVLRVSNSSKIIDFNKVISFIKRLSKDKTVSRRMREFALNKIDYKIKLQQMIDFTSDLEKRTKDLF